MPARGYSLTPAKKKDGKKRAAAPSPKPNLGEALAKLGETTAMKAGDKKLAAKSHAQGKAAAKKTYQLKPVGGLRVIDAKALKSYQDKHGGPVSSNGVASRQKSVLGGINEAILKTTKNVVVATAEAPGAVLKNTAKGARDTVAAIPAGIVKAATTRPDKTAKAILDDYKKRYGQSDREQIERFKKEGVAPELLDATIAVGASGASVGRGATKAAEKGALGARAKAVATIPRPALRTTGGKATPQAKSRNYFKAEVQTKVDTRRAKKLTATSKDEPTAAVQAVARAANEKAGKVVEVVPSARHVAKAQRVRVATTKGRAVQGLKAEQIRIVEKTARHVLNQLDDHERAAFYHVASGTVSADPKRAVPQLARRRESILEQRAARAIDTPDGLRKKTDELRTIDKLLAHPDKSFTPRVRDTVEALRAVDLHVSRQDPTLNPRQRVLRRYAQQAETLGLRRGEGGAMYDPNETTSSFIKRVREAADGEGLERPLYFPSEKYALADNPDFASRAVGGARATKPSFKYTGELFRTGRQDTTPEVFLTGLSRTIKRKHNHRLIAATLDEHAFEGLTNMKVGQLKERLTSLGVAVNGGSVAYWNPGLFKERLRGADTAAPGHKNLDDADRAALVQEGEDFAEAQTNNALAQSLVLPEQMTPEMKNGGGWAAVPRHAYDEIMQATRPSGASARSWDIAKSKQSRILLGTANIPWLGFQVASNALLAGAATKGRVPLALVEQSRWYRKLSDDDRQLVDELVGDSASHSSAGRTHMGAASNARLVNQYRALKANPIWDRQLKGKGPSLRQLNPIEAMFALDRAQNNAFRRAVLHDQMKRGAAQRMAGDIESVRGLQEKVTRAIVGRPNDVVTKMLRDREVMEQHAKHVDDWLGNWTTFTSKERAVGNRFLMFYPYLRFSLKLTFQTLPAHHPILLSIAGKLGALQQDELERLGVADLPWAAGRLYFQRDGKLHQIDLARMNPAMNAITSFKQPSQLYGALPPVVQTFVADQLNHSTSFKDEEWRVNGTPSQYGAQGSDYGLRVRGRIALDDILSLAYPYRAAKSLTLAGPQGDDSLLFDPRPMQYKDKKVTKAIKDSVGKKAAEPHRVVKELLPLLGEETDDPAVAKSRRERDNPKPKRKKHALGGSFDGGFGSGGFGGGGF